MSGVSSGIDGGAGGVQPDLSSSAASGDATTGSNSVFVGGFNPPKLADNTQMFVVIGIVLVAVFWLKNKKR